MHNNIQLRGLEGIREIALPPLACFTLTPFPRSTPTLCLSRLRFQPFPCITRAIRPAQISGSLLRRAAISLSRRRGTREKERRRGANVAETAINRGVKRRRRMVLGVVGTGRSWKRNEHTLETHDLLVFIRMLYFLGSNRSLYRGGKYISSALINDIYIQMDKKKKREESVFGSFARTRSANHSCRFRSFSPSLSSSQVATSRPLRRTSSSRNIFCT